MKKSDANKLRSSLAFRSKNEILNESIEDSPQSESLPEKQVVDYQEELVLSMYYSLLNLIIDEIVVFPPEVTSGAGESGDEEEECVIKDFYNLRMDELRDLDVLYVNDSKVVLSAKQSFNRNASSTNWLCVGL